MTKNKRCVVSNNTFTGVTWDGKSAEAVVYIAKALCNLTELFQAQNIKIDSLLKIGVDGDGEVER
jgi:hypothetical protein